MKKLSLYALCPTRTSQIRQGNGRNQAQQSLQEHFLVYRLYNSCSRQNAVVPSSKQVATKQTVPKLPKYRTVKTTTEPGTEQHPVVHKIAVFKVSF